MRALRVSAPGKALVTGGYLVLDERFSGLVLSTSARFYAQVATVVAVRSECALLSRAELIPTFNDAIRRRSSVELTMAGCLRSLLRARSTANACQGGSFGGAIHWRLSWSAWHEKVL